jgi:hypothetical protein
LIFKFFENQILQNPFSETRAGQGFQRHRNKTFARKSGGPQGSSTPAVLSQQIYFRVRAGQSGFIMKRTKGEFPRWLIFGGKPERDPAAKRRKNAAQGASPGSSAR